MPEAMVRSVTPRLTQRSPKSSLLRPEQTSSAFRSAHEPPKRTEEHDKSAEHDNKTVQITITNSNNGGKADGRFRFMTRTLAILGLALMYYNSFCWWSPMTTTTTGDIRQEESTEADLNNTEETPTEDFWSTFQHLGQVLNTLDSLRVLGSSLLLLPWVQSWMDGAKAMRRRIRWQRGEQRQGL